MTFLPVAPLNKMNFPQISSQKEAWKDRMAAMRYLPRLWRLLWEAASYSVAGTIFLRILGGLSPLAMLYTAKRLVDLIFQASKGQTADIGQIWFWVGAEFSLVAISQIISKAVDYLDVLIAGKFSSHLALKVMRHAATLDLASFEDPAFHDRLERARAQVTDRTGMLTSAGWLLQRVVMLVSLAAGIIAYSPWLLVVLILSVLPAFLVESHFAFLGYTQAHELTSLNRRLEYYLTLASSKETAKELKVFALAPYLEGKYSEGSSGVLMQHRQLAARRLLWGALFAALASIAYYGCYAFVAQQAFYQKMSMGTFTFMVGAIAGANGHLQTIFTLFSSIADQALFLGDLMLFFEQKSSIDFSRSTAAPPRPLQTGLVFDNVSFQYPGSEKPIFDQLSFCLEKGRRFALVGENGEVKTTIVKLIARLYEPTGGRILLDGRDLKDYDIEELRKEIGVIFQDFIRYDLSARENIAVGDISRLSDDEGLWDASRKSSHRIG